MKIRNGFVSNSSSSSFLVIGEENLRKLGAEYVRLTPNQAKVAIEDYLEGYSWRKNDKNFFNDCNINDIYLTEFISDCSDTYDKVNDLDEAVHWEEGGHGSPYDHDDYISLNGLPVDSYDCVHFPKYLQDKVIEMEYKLQKES